jgi:RNA polymerase sigma-70 factor, ECF subfamily
MAANVTDVAHPSPLHDGPNTPPDIRHLHIAHGPVLMAFVTRLTKGDTGAAEEIVRATLAYARTDPAARDAGGRWNRSRLVADAERRWLDRSREISAAAERIDQIVDAAEVRVALDALPEALRTTLVELHFRGRPVAAVAELMGVTEETVTARAHLGLRELRDVLRRRGFDFGSRSLS